MNQPQTASNGTPSITTTISLTEAQKREAVFPMPREVVIVKVYGDRQYPGFPKVARDPALEFKRFEEARELGVSALAYDGETPHTGFCLFDRVRDVSIAGVGAALRDAGLVFVGGHFSVDDRGRQVNTLTFQRGGEEAKLDADVAHWLANAEFAQGTVWCNRRYREVDGQKVYYRLDSLNLVQSRETRLPSRRVQLAGDTWQIA